MTTRGTRTLPSLTNDNVLIKDLKQPSESRSKDDINGDSNESGNKSFKIGERLDVPLSKLRPMYELTELIDTLYLDLNLGM